MNRGIRTVILLLVAMFVVIATPVCTQVVPEDGGALLPTRIAITDRPGEQFDPHVDGDLAVYSTAIFAGSTLIETIEYYRFSTGIASTVPSQPGVVTEDLLSDVDQGRIAFTRIFPGLPSGRDGRVAIMLFDTASGTLQELAPLPDSRRFAPALGAQTVAFVDEQLAGDGTGEIMVLDLASSLLTRLTSDTVADFGPAVSPDGNVVVWQRCPTFQNCDIYGASRSGGAWSVRPLATTAFNESYPDTNGVDVLFERDNFGGPTGSNIVRIPVNGGLETELQIPGEQYLPSVRGSMVTFESRVLTRNPDIYLYDLAGNKLFRITDTPGIAESLNDVTVLPTGEVRLVWQGYTTASNIEGDIYAATFRVPTTNTAPTAVAGPNQRAIPGAIIHLNGNGSFDNNTPTNLLLYAWTFASVPAGSVATLAAANTMTPSFTPDLAGDYVVRLVVTDQDALSSPPSLVTIGENPAPTADAGPDQLVIVGHVVALSGAGADPDGDPLTYAWALTGTPAGSSASLSSSTLANTSFLADRPGVYAAQFTVSDLFGPGAPDGVRITATTANGYADNLVQQASRIILDLPTSAVTNRGNQNALIQFLSHVIVAVQSGDLATARQQLAQAISRTDGCALRGMPDGSGPSRDWITTCAAQSQVYPLLIDALAAITP